MIFLIIDLRHAFYHSFVSHDLVYVRFTLLCIVADRTLIMLIFDYLHINTVIRMFILLKKNIVFHGVSPI